MARELTWDSVIAEAESDDASVDLARAALLFALVEYPDLDIDHELSLLDSLAAGAALRLGDNRETIFAINTLSEYLFDEVGLQGNTDEYYDPRNSYLNQVLKRQLGIPITLSLVYLEVGKRLGIPLVGIGMPGHFLLRHRDETELFVDPFNRGILLSEEECAQRLTEITQSRMDWDPNYCAHQQPGVRRSDVAQPEGYLPTAKELFAGAEHNGPFGADSTGCFRGIA